MQTSAQGRAALELEEGVVLRAYRDVAGLWTIGAGLTAASGVVKPVAGMVITRAEADEMLAEALRTYENQVEIAMTTTGPAIVRPVQRAFDAGVSFHFNTGAISRASWVALWKAKALPQTVRAALCLWSKAGGKVLPSLKARREREFEMLLDGVYRTPAPASDPHPVYARWGLTLSADETCAVFASLRKLGYNPGDGADLIKLAAVLLFQKDHALTVDGIIGRATLSALQRALDSQTKAQMPIAATAAAIGGAVTGLTDQLVGLPQVDSVSMVVAGAWLVGQLWIYRDQVAATVAPTFPRIAAFLRSR